MLDMNLHRRLRWNPLVAETAPIMTEKTPLEDIITARIAATGRITFAAFMEACLYEPGLGYYTSPGRRWGGGGFYTSISVHAAFGRS